MFSQLDPRFFRLFVDPNEQEDFKIPIRRIPINKPEMQMPNSVTLTTEQLSLLFNKIENLEKKIDTLSKLNVAVYKLLKSNNLIE